MLTLLNRNAWYGDEIMHKERDRHVTFDIDGNPNRPTLLILLIAIIIGLCIALFFYKNELIIFSIMILVLFTYIVFPKKVRAPQKEKDTDPSAEIRWKPRLKQ